MNLWENQVAVRYVSKFHDDFVWKDVIFEELELSGPLGILGLGYNLVFGRQNLFEEGQVRPFLDDKRYGLFTRFPKVQLELRDILSILALS